MPIVFSNFRDTFQCVYIKNKQTWRVCLGVGIQRAQEKNYGPNLDWGNSLQFLGLGLNNPTNFHTSFYHNTRLITFSLNTCYNNTTIITLSPNTYYHNTFNNNHKSKHILLKYNDYHNHSLLETLHKYLKKMILYHEKETKPSPSAQSHFENRKLKLLGKPRTSPALFPTPTPTPTPCTLPPLALVILLSTTAAANAISLLLLFEVNFLPFQFSS